MSSFLDHVAEPHNFNPVSAPFDLLVSDLFLKLDATNAENKAPYNSVSEKKTSIIETFIDTWRTHFGPNIYSAVRLIFPNRDARKYYIKDVALSRLVVRLLGLQKGSADYTMIQNWKKSYHHKLRLAGDEERRSLGDLSLLVSRIMSRRRNAADAVKSTVSVDEVNDVLDRLTQTSQASDQMELLGPFLARLTIPEVRFFFSMILKESMLSFFERSFFLSWHPDAYELFKVCNDMKKIFWLLSDPSQRLDPKQLCVQPMYQFVPQSSKKLDISYDALCKKMTVPLERRGKDPKLVQAYDEGGVEGHFLIEEKLDGDRMLMHMAGGKFLWHTRRRRDYTLVYGENVHIGSLTKNLASAFHESVHSVILDGEMVAWSKDRNCLLPFGTLRSAAVQEALKQFDIVDVYEGNNSWPLYIVFDILHLNGKDLTSLPLFYRKQLLKKVVHEVPHRFEVLEWVKAKHPEDLKANMQKIVSENNEGIMVKSLLSKYRVYSRDSTWIKVKPEYLESFGENLDLVVIGKIGRVKTSYVCGLRDDENEGTYKSFCAVANGFSNAVYRQIESKLCNFWVDYHLQKPPKAVMVFGTKKPDFWIHPANSVVLEIKARSIEVTAETPYAAGSTLHNLWCRSVREDKGYEECISLQEYHDLKSRYSRDIFKTQAVNRDRKRDFENSIYQKYNKPKRRKPNEKSSLFNATTFIIATDYKHPDTGEVMAAATMRRLVAEHGGTVWLDLHKDDARVLNTVIIGEVTTPRLGRWMEEGFDIVRPQWIYECVQRRFLVPLEPQFMFHVTSRKLGEAIAHREDEFGDSYTISAASSKGFLHHLLGLRVDRQLKAEPFERTAQDTALAAGAYEGGIHRGLFYGAAFYIVLGDGPLARSEYCRVYHRIGRFGGTVMQQRELNRIGFIVVPDSAINNGGAKRMHHELLQELAKTFSESARLPYVVSADFISASIAAGEMVDASCYAITQ
ncbi:hypothetical protein JCM33374_g3516 [Metschnikowia sp. JCM 33374]|nr:hypothetical protein JCM33374_g3516 [Metschnikowia sp. JCM 33374]